MDETLRALERAARADPTDRAAGWALVRGLDRAGDAVAAWRERCRLARGGDLSAWDELTWCPRGVRSEPRVTARVDCPRAGVLGGGGADVVVVHPLYGSGMVRGLDARTFEPRWSIEGQNGTWLGPCLAVLREDRVALVRGADGHELTSVDFPGADLARSPQGQADRILLLGGDQPATWFTVDLGLAPRVEGPPAGVGSWAHVLAGDLVAWSAPPRPEAAGDAPELFAVSVHDPTRRWPLPGSWVRGADARSIVVGWGDPHDHEAKEKCSVVDSGTGGVLWHLNEPRGASVESVSLEGEDLLVATTAGTAGCFERRDRLTGALRWQATFPATDVVVHPAADVVYALAHDEQPPVRGASTTIHALDRASGTLLWSRRGSFLSWFALLEEAIVIIEEGDHRLLRLEA